MLFLLSLSTENDFKALKTVCEAMSLARVSSVRAFCSKPPAFVNNLWQDPIYGYFETHGKMEFKPGEEYGLTEEQKKAVMERYRRKNMLKQQYLAMEYDPDRFRYIHGVIVDPAMFRWYAADMLNAERFYWTPKTVFLTMGVLALIVYSFCRISNVMVSSYEDRCRDGDFLWWDRNIRMPTSGGTKRVLYCNA
ncbi:NADH dehydrogenase [ubiquinone] 1 beta subcomplex subunit [Trichinella pseudospiralis]